VTAVFGIAGFKNAGKTTLTERLVAELTGRGYVVSTVKHAHHAFDIDHEGRDSHRHRKAGAREVAIVSRNRWALVHELRGEAEPAFAAVLAKLEACDLVLVEGYKREGHAKLEVRRAGLDHPKLAGEDHTVVAIAADFAIADAPVPVLDMNDIAAVADFIVAHVKLEPRP
jgi:molybdopterin-guanine dinucleotide biosynthesis adapter protein